jgi:hypothetical protein
MKKIDLNIIWKHLKIRKDENTSGLISRFVIRWVARIFYEAPGFAMRNPVPVKIYQPHTDSQNHRDYCSERHYPTVRRVR